MDFREGGRYIFHMRASEELGDEMAGQDFYNGGAFRAIEPLECLEFDQRMTDKDGNEIDPGEVGMPPDFPEVVRTRLTFKRVDGKTELTWRECDWPVGEMIKLSEQGVRESLDKLAEALARHRRATR
jgi:uncharacterized protein YndB with AHSA1/START domain